MIFRAISRSCGDVAFSTSLRKAVSPRIFSRTYWSSRKNKERDPPAIDDRTLLDALWGILPRSKYAAGGEVDATRFSIPTEFEVHGVGKVSLPLSQQDFFRLRAVSEQAPYGKGEQTRLDTSVRRAWQISASKVSCPQIPDFFTKVVHDLVAPAMAELGADPTALMADVRLYKMLLYEQGGHFKFHTEKEDGVFATMILQLPTESGFEGGELEIRHRKKILQLDFSPSSSKGYFQTVFFCDCEHMLAEVKSGTRLCLIFSLVSPRVSQSTKLIDVGPDRVSDFVLAVGKVQSLLKEWAMNVEGRKEPLLAIPLGHQYSKNSLSFAGLKGHDRVVASLLLSCSSFLKIHLAMLIKEESTSFADHGIGIKTTNYSLENWISENDEKVEEFEPASFDYYDRVLGSYDDPFRAPYDGDRNTSLYRTAVVVVWPHAAVGKMNVLFTLLSDVDEPGNWFEKEFELDPIEANKFWHFYVDRKLSMADSRLLERNNQLELMRSILKLSVKLDKVHDAALPVMKKAGAECFEWGGLLVDAAEKFAWNEWECLEKMIEEMRTDGSNEWLGVVEFVTSLSSRVEDKAIWLVKILVRDDSLLSEHVKLINPLGCLAAKLGLEKETCTILLIGADVYRTTGYYHDFAQVLDLVMTSFPDRGFQHVDKFWETYFRIQDSDADQPRRFSELCDFVLGMIESGRSEEAVALVTKYMNYEEVHRKTGLDELVLLLSCDERFHDIIRKFKPSVSKLKQDLVWDWILTRMKGDEEITRLCSEIFSRLIGAGEIDKKIGWNLKENGEMAKVFSEMLLRLQIERQKKADEDLMREEKIMDMVRKRMEAPERFWTSDSWVEMTKALSSVARDELKQLVEARIDRLWAGEFKKGFIDPRSARIGIEEEIEELESAFCTTTQAES